MELLTQANDWLISRFGELGPLYAVGVLGVILVALTLPAFLRRQADPLDKLKSQSSGVGRGPQTKDEKKALRHRGEPVMPRVMAA